MDEAKEATFAAQGCGLSEKTANFIIAMLQLDGEQMSRLRGFIHHRDRIELVLERDGE